MTTLKNSLTKLFGILGAIVIAPFVALFGLMMLGFGVGLSIIAVIGVSMMARQAQASDAQGLQSEAVQPAL